MTASDDLSSSSRRRRAPARACSRSTSTTRGAASTSPRSPSRAPIPRSISTGPAARPDPAVQADNFSVRWSGQVLAPVTGTLHLHHDVGRRRPPVCERSAADRQLDRSRGRRRTARTIALVADQRYDIRMDFYDHGQLATARLSWAYPGPDASDRAAVGAVPGASGQSAAHGRCGCGSGRSRCPSRASADRHRPRRWLAGPSLTTTWSKISGREDSAGGTVDVRQSERGRSTTATFGADGIYVLRLTVSDGAVTVSDDVTITVNPRTAQYRAGGQRRAPTGRSRCPSSATLAATATDDGLPSPPAQLSTELDEE